MEHETTQQIEDIIDLKDAAITLEDIEVLASNKKLLKNYEKRFKGHLYSAILMSLTHESFPEKEAKSLWNQIVDHMQQLNKSLGRNVGIAVAALDYLSNIKKKLSEPKIIEEDKSRFVADASTKDELTGLYLRDVFDVVLKKEVDEVKRTNSSLCLLMIDIDDFKKVNDKYGHQTGDKVLEKIGATLNASVREMDLAVRYGGEELAVIMPAVNLKKAQIVAERIRKSVEKIQFEDFSVTISIGVSQTSKELSSSEKLIKSADIALYQAKKRGKNQVCLSSHADD